MAILLKSMMAPAKKPVPAVVNKQSPADDGCFGRKRRHHHSQPQRHPPQKHQAASGSATDDPIPMDASGCCGRKRRHHHHQKRPQQPRHGAATTSTFASDQIQNMRRRRRRKTEKKDLNQLAKKSTPISKIATKGKIPLEMLTKATDPKAMRKAILKTGPQKLSLGRVAKPRPRGVSAIHINLAIHPQMVTPTAVAVQ